MGANQSNLDHKTALFRRNADTRQPERFSVMFQSTNLADRAPSDNKLTGYDEQHLTLYLRLLDAEREKSNWEDVVRSLFGIDPKREPGRARRVLESHLVRARWIATNGFGHLI